MGYIISLFIGALIGCVLGLLIASIGGINKKHDYYKEGYDAGYDKRRLEEEKYEGNF